MEYDNSEIPEQVRKLSELIRLYRTRRNLSLRQLSARFGISHGYLGKLERGLNTDGDPISPTIKIICKLSDGMGITTKQLLEYCGYIEEALDNYGIPNKLQDINYASPNSITPNLLVADDIEHTFDNTELEVISELSYLLMRLQRETTVLIGYNTLNNKSRTQVSDELRDLIVKLHNEYGKPHSF